MQAKEVIIGVDIGGTNTALGIVDANGRILHQTLFPTRKAQNVEDFIVRLANSIIKLQQNLSQDHVLRGIGIAAPTANYFRGTIKGPANLQWGEVELVKKIKTQFDLSCSQSELYRVISGITARMPSPPERSTNSHKIVGFRNQ